MNNQRKRSNRYYKPPPRLWAELVLKVIFHAGGILHVVDKTGVITKDWDHYILWLAEVQILASNSFY